MAAKVDGVGLDQPYLLRHPEGVPSVNGAKHLTTDGNSADDVYLQQYICYSTLILVNKTNILRKIRYLRKCISLRAILNNHYQLSSRNDAVRPKVRFTISYDMPNTI